MPIIVVGIFFIKFSHATYFIPLDPHGITNTYLNKAYIAFDKTLFLTLE